MAVGKRSNALVLCVSMFVLGALSLAASTTPDTFVAAMPTTSGVPTTLVTAAAPTSSVSTIAAPTITVPVTTLAATDVTGTNGDLVDAIGAVVGITMDGSILPEPDPACFEEAIAALEPAVQQAADQLAADTFAWWDIASERRLPIVAAYVGCSDIDSVLYVLAIGTVNALESAPCVAASWSSVLTADIIASSIAFGTGFDDLPPGVVARLVDGAVGCMTDDERWWIDDVVLEIDGQYDLTPEQAMCVATNFVRKLGISRVVERRILTLPMLALSDADLAAIDLPACGVTVTLPPMTLGRVGDCLADVFRADEWPRVACDTPHNGEIIAAVDLTDVLVAWPGNQAMYDLAQISCVAVAEDAMNRHKGDEQFKIWWFPPSREVWERGGRILICLVGPFDTSDWTAPFGLLPPTTTTTPVAVAADIPAPTQQPTGLGTDARMDLLAIACFNGTMQACDDLHDESPVGSAYENFADTCAGRRPAGTGRYCTDVFTDTDVQ
jgi:hypothetical protein